MFTITSTAGLHTSAPTVSAVAAVLGQHLSDLAPGGPINWEITAPGPEVHRGHLNLHGLPDDGFIADTITDVTAALLRKNLAAAPIGPAASQALQ